MKNLNTDFYKATSDDTKLNCSCANGAMKLYLPSVKEGGRIVVKKTDTTSNAITVLPVRREILDDAVCQVETATVVGTITKAGNASVVVTALGMTGTPKTLSVAVAVDDTASIVAGKIRLALKYTDSICGYTNGMFNVSGSGPYVVLTQIEPTGNDSTINISIDNDTCEGLTQATTSANTFTGSAITLSSQNSYACFITDGKTWSMSDFSGVNEVETLKNKIISPTTNLMKNVVISYAGNIDTEGLNAGTVIVPAITGRAIRILRYSLVVNGAYNSGTGTNIIIEDTDASAPIVATTIAVAALTDGAKISSGSTIANVTDGAGMIGTLTLNKGIQVVSTGTQSVGESIDLTVYYMYV